MIPSTSVRASVVDIRSPATTLPTSVVVDANVLYFVYYNFAAVISAGGKPPAPHQRDSYPKWWTRATSKRVNICTTAGCLAEFAHVVERSELEILWRTDPDPPQLDPTNPDQDYSARYAKTVRYLYPTRLETIRTDVETTTLSVRKTVAVTPQIGDDENVFTRVLKEWIPSTSDFNDAALVDAAKRVGIPRVVSDDADLISFAGITVYTANRRAVDAARASGKLLT